MRRDVPGQLWRRSSSWVAAHPECLPLTLVKRNHIYVHPHPSTSSWTLAFREAVKGTLAQRGRVGAVPTNRSTALDCVLRTPFLTAGHLSGVRHHSGARRESQPDRNGHRSHSKLLKSTKLKLPAAARPSQVGCDGPAASTPPLLQRPMLFPWAGIRENTIHTARRGG